MQATNGSPGVTDSLAQNSSLNWEEYDLAGNRGCTFAGGAYHVKEQQQGYFETCYARASNFRNLTLQVQMTLLSGDAGKMPGLVFSFQDLTEITKLEQEIRGRDRLAALGKMAAGIAHEIRNPLAAMRGSIQASGFKSPNSRISPSKAPAASITAMEPKRMTLLNATRSSSQSASCVSRLTCVWDLWLSVI